MAIDTSSTTSVASWDFRNSFVQSNVNPGGSFIRAASVLLAAGPPSLQHSSWSQIVAPGFNGSVSLNDDALAKAFPIGLVESISINQSKGLQQIFEIGSMRKYFIPGQTQNQFGMNRVLFDGASLMKALYAYYINPEDPHNDSTLAVPTGSMNKSDTITLRNQPGFDQTFLNLGSELFNRPIGLLMLIHNGDDQGVAAAYLEYCFLQAHQMAISAGSMLFAESVSGMFDRIVPINMNYGKQYNQNP